MRLGLFSSFAERARCFVSITSIAGLMSGAAFGCGGSSSSGGGGGSGSSGGGASTSDFAGVYTATYSGTYVVTSPAGTPGGSNTSSGTITVTNLANGQIGIAFTIPPNPESGVIDFALMGNSGTATGPATGGSCFAGDVDGNTQSNCCTSCSIVFSGDTLTQPNSGTFTGTTAAGDPYSGTYSGTWTGTKQ
jgi:hypothetical protein